METIYSDVTVVGAGYAGICAALAAARHGLKVALVNDRPVPGGNASSEINVNVNGSAGHGGSPSVYAREGGLVEELKLTTLYYSTMDFERKNPASIDAAFFDLIYAEKNITLFLNTLVYDADMEKEVIKAVRGKQLSSEREFVFFSPLFIDSSGDGTVGCKAGAAFTMGREGKGQYGESLAPEEADDYTLGGTLLFESRDTGQKVTYKRPAFAYDITKMDFFKHLKNKELHRVFYKHGREYLSLWWIEYGGQVDTIADNEAVALELRRLVYGIWDYIKNSGDFADVENLVLDRVAPVVAKRESRRFIGDYVLTQKDIDDKTDFFDAVSIGGWTMDDHAPKGIYDEGPATHWYFVPGIYNIPFRSLYSKNVPNLMFAGRDASMSHVAFSSTRLISTGGCMGQAVGTAAYICKKYGIMPAQLTARYISELADTLQRDDQTLAGRPEKGNEELCKDVRITASSTRALVNEISCDTICLDRELWLAIPVCTSRLASLEVKIRNSSPVPADLDIQIWGGDRPENYLPTQPYKKFQVRIQAGFDGWYSLPIDCARPADGKIYISFGKNDSLRLYCNEEELTGVACFGRRDLKDDMKNPRYPIVLGRMKKNICFRNILPWQNLYKVDNILNGYSRPYGGVGLWSSEALGPCGEQWIELNYDVPKTVEEIQLVFNSRLTDDNLSPDNVQRLVKDYTVEVTDAAGGTQRLEVRGNYLRFRRHAVHGKNVVKIKLTFQATNGIPYCEVFSVKLY